MTTAQAILITYGVFSLLYGFALGVPLSRARSVSPSASRHLVTAHLSAIMQGPVHVSVAVALGFTGAAAWVETTAAVLLVAGSTLFLAGATLNWLQHVDDHFAVHSTGWKLFAASSAGHLTGMAVVATCVVTRV